MDNYNTVLEYAKSIVEGRKVACEDQINICRRFLADLKDPRYEFSIREPEFVIQFIEKCCAHKEGQKLDGTPLLGAPLLLEPWEKFIVYNILGFKLKGTNERRFKEAFICIPRKNG